MQTAKEYGHFLFIELATLEMPRQGITRKGSKTVIIKIRSGSTDDAGWF